MDEPTWLTRRMVDAMHAVLIREDGGSHGVRDDGLVDSALARPRHRWGYEPGADVFDLAASYGYGLTKNHGFVDGNERMGLAAAGAFLYVNGWMLDAPEPEAVVTMEGVAAGSVSEEELATWLRGASVPRDRRWPALPRTPLAARNSLHPKQLKREKGGSVETKGSKTDQRDFPQREKKHPDEWERDLNPNRMAGQNVGSVSSEDERGIRTAFDVKPLHRAMRDWPDEDLKRVPVLEEGTRLQQGATYLDLRDPDRGEFTATGDMAAGPRDAYVPKDEVPYPTWNRLRGIDDPERAP